MKQINFDQFLDLDIRTGTVKEVKLFPEARKPAYKLWIDFGGDTGIKKSSAQITERYTIDELIGRQILAVVNFPPRQIGPFVSEVLVLGVHNQHGEVCLLQVDGTVPDGSQML